MLPYRMAMRLAPGALTPSMAAAPSYLVANRTVSLARLSIQRLRSAGRSSAYHTSSGAYNRALSRLSSSPVPLTSGITAPISWAATTSIASYSLARRSYSDRSPGPPKPPTNVPPFPRPPGEQPNGADVTEGVNQSATSKTPESDTLAGKFDSAQPEFSSPKPSDVNDAEATPEPSSAPKTPLPDLRHGIPSTFEAEFLRNAASKQAAESGRVQHDLDITDADPETSGRGGSGGRGDGEIPKGAYESSIDKKRNAMANYTFFAILLAAVGGGVYLGRNWDTEAEAAAHPDAPSGWGPKLFYDRVKARLSGQMGYYTEPAFPKLLPVMDDQPVPPYTLVISLEDMLVHSEWSREHGWRTAKRPGADFFLLYLSQYYEICLFTSLPSAMADPIYRKLDPYHVIMWPLYREATRYENGEYVKDLSYLNRPLNRTVLVDSKAAHASSQPENAIILPPWKGDPSDRDLVQLVPFLEHMAVMGIEDIRTALASYSGTHIPTEYAAREARMRAEHQRAFAASNAGKKRRAGASSSLFGSLAGSLGMSPGAGLVTEPGAANISEGLAEGKMLSDIVREDGMRRYRLMEKEIRENGEKWLKEEAELEKKMQAEQMKDMKTKWFGIGGGESK